MSENAHRVANIMRQAHEAKVELMLHNSMWGNAPYVCSFTVKRDNMECKGQAEGTDPLQTVIDAWEGFEELALRGNKKLLAPQLEAPKEDY